MPKSPFQRGGGGLSLGYRDAHMPAGLSEETFNSEIHRAVMGGAAGSHRKQGQSSDRGLLGQGAREGGWRSRAGCQLHSPPVPPQASPAQSKHLPWPRLQRGEPQLGQDVRLGCAFPAKRRQPAPRSPCTRLQPQPPPGPATAATLSCSLVRTPHASPRTPGAAMLPPTLQHPVPPLQGSLPLPPGRLHPRAIWIPGQWLRLRVHPLLAITELWRLPPG